MTEAQQYKVIKGNVGSWSYDIDNNIYKLSVANNHPAGTTWFNVQSSYSPQELNKNPKIPIRKGSFVVIKCWIDSYGDLFLTKSEENYLKVLK